MRNLSATEYFQFVRSGASEGIKNKMLSKDSVRGYIRHLPIKGCPEFDAWGEEILDISDKCLHELYEYSKAIEYIDKDFLYEKFVKREF